METAKHPHILEMRIYVPSVGTGVKNGNETPMALLHKYLKLLRGKDRQLKALID
jgi:hypothetical protein